MSSEPGGVENQGKRQQEREESNNDQKDASHRPLVTIVNSPYNERQTQRPQYTSQSNVKAALEVIGIVLIFTYTIFQGMQLLVSRDNERRQLQAYLATTTIRIQCCVSEEPAAHEARDLVFLTIKNGGLTPANDVGATINWHPIPYETTFPANFAYPDYQATRAVLESKAVLLPQAETTFTWVINPQNIRDARARSTRLILYGHVNFIDVFDTTRISNFCYVYYGTSAGGENFDNCPEHNGEPVKLKPWYSWVLSVI